VRRIGKANFKKTEFLSQVEAEIVAEYEKEMRWMFWFNLKKNHPLAYEIIQWVILMMCAIAIIINIMCIVG